MEAGALVEVGLIRPLYSPPIYQVLPTLGQVPTSTRRLRQAGGRVTWAARWQEWTTRCVRS